MSIHVSTGEAFIDGRCVATVMLREEWVARMVPVPIPGENRVDYKDLSHSGQAYVQFETVEDPNLRGRLELLVEFASTDVERRRAIRDAGQRAISLEFRLEDDRNVQGIVEPPVVAQATIKNTLFRVSLPA